MHTNARSSPLTLSNALSLSRIFFIPPILFFLEQDTAAGNFRAVLLIVAAGATDWLDGYFARRRQQISDLGRIIDPLADKIAVGAIAIYLTVRRDFPGWFLLLILARDFVILAFGLLMTSRHHRVPESDWFGKVAVTGVAVVLVVYVLELRALELPLVMVSAALFGLSMASYFERFRQQLRNTEKHTSIEERETNTEDRKQIEG